MRVLFIGDNRDSSVTHFDLCRISTDNPYVQSLYRGPCIWHIKT